MSGKPAARQGDMTQYGGIRTDDERTHRYHYDSQHRLVHYTRTQYEVCLPCG
ncbi:hypothetical protein [Escherichia coli]|uniref:hypothetical protein n=1 Tax=Escherichia coli TaxID=562 RepID=UPI0028832672|nr:hypothetical protein [Escherichia coli]